MDDDDDDDDCSTQSLPVHPGKNVPTYCHYRRSVPFPLALDFNRGGAPRLARSFLTLFFSLPHVSDTLLYTRAIVFFTRVTGPLKADLDAVII